MIFPERHPFGWAARTPTEAHRFDRYLEGRKRYKGDLLEALAEGVTTGPVLEVNNGFGAFGVELLDRTGAALHALCEDERARRLYRRKLRERGLTGRCRLLDRRGGAWPFAPGTFELAYSINCLHEWDCPREVLEELYPLLRPGGALVVNDLKRDADPFITEYVIREMAAEESEEGRFHLDVFLRSLRSAWSVDELKELLSGTGFDEVAVDAGDAMTVTLWIRKRG
jgi:SAM-dependent methyltransferase